MEAGGGDDQPRRLSGRLSPTALRILQALGEDQELPQEDHQFLGEHIHRSVVMVGIGVPALERKVTGMLLGLPSADLLLLLRSMAQRARGGEPGESELRLRVAEAFSLLEEDPEFGTLFRRPLGAPPPPPRDPGGGSSAPPATSGPMASPSHRTEPLPRLCLPRHQVSHAPPPSKTDGEARHPGTGRRGMESHS